MDSAMDLSIQDMLLRNWIRILQSMDSKPRRYGDLKAAARLDSIMLSRCLKALQQNSLVASRPSGADGGKPDIYEITDQGRRFQKILSMFLKTVPGCLGKTTNRFILDSPSFMRLYSDKGLKNLRRMFGDSEIFITDFGFVELTDPLLEDPDDALGEFLHDDGKMTVVQYYRDSNASIKKEFDLRHARKISQGNARLIASALDYDAGLVSAHKRVVEYAKQEGVLAVNVAELGSMAGCTLSERFGEVIMCHAIPVPVQTPKLQAGMPRGSN